ncbi:sterol desaturase family protein [Roseomonas marmotae]|uniref:Sterol desaturase family protein n=2 Tax=Roseomonas marmotae TaxID=2768161 RepID=A0ABS3K7L4_9PROT|nr:sterol desaturase family protein [Roseomonas marmotae]QTI80853.1 sterol desaturase family protein [Roseomonas marmotae]
MELTAYLAHRYVMHGPGWGWHRSHHEEHEGWWEKNDLYALVFVGISLALMWLDPEHHLLFWIGTGMAVYGLLYAVVHDGLVHRRWPFRWVPRRGYLQRLYQAHRLHHAVEGKQGAVSFGFLYAPPVRVLREQLRQQHGKAPGDIRDASTVPVDVELPRERP